MSTPAERPTRRPLSYIVPKEAWYSHVVIDDEDSISVGTYAESGGCDYEFVIRWHSFSRPTNRTSGAMQVEIFSDAWQAFTDHPDFFLWLAALTRKNENPTFAEVREFLDSMGLKDVTERERGKR